MADEFKVVVRAELDKTSLNTLKNDISNLSNTRPKLQADTSRINAQIKSIRNQLNSLSNIRINIGGNNGGSNNSGNVINSTMQRLRYLQTEMQNTNTKLGKLDLSKNKQQIEELRKDLQSLLTEYNRVLKQSNGTIPNNEFQRMSQDAERFERRLKEIGAIKIDTANVDKITRAFNRLKEIQNEISKKTIKVNGLDVDKDSSQIETLRNQIIGLQEEYNKIFNYNKGNFDGKQMNELSKSAVKMQEELNLVQSKMQDVQNRANQKIVTKIETGEVNRNLSDIEAKIQKLTSKKINIGTGLTDEVNKLKQLGNALNNTTDVSKLSSLWENYRQQLAKVRNGLKEVENENHNVANSSNSLTRSLGQFALYYVSIYQVFNQFKEGCQFIRELDDAMTNINYTMEVTKSQLQDVANSSIQMADDLKTSTSDILQAVTLYANAKESTESILQKSTTAIELSNVTGMTGEESAKLLQSVMNQFNMTQDDLTHISDVIQTVSQNMAYDFSSGVKEISDGIEVSGSVARQAGMDLEQYSSMLGLTIERTGLSGSVIGNAYKSIFTRVTKASKAFGTLDEDISKAEESLRSAGVSVRSSDGEFRDMNEILGDLAKVWNSLNEVTQSNISYNIAGTRQTNIINSLLSSYEDYEALIDKANNANGTTAENQEKYAESVTATMQDLKNSMEAFWKSFIDSDSIKGVLTILKSVVDVITSISKVTSGLGTVIMGIGIAKVILNLKNGISVLTTFKSLITGLTGLKGLKSFFSIFSTDIKNGATATMALGNAMQATSVTATTLKLALTGVVTGIGLAITAYGYMQQKHEEQIQAIEEKAQKSQEEIKSISETKDAYDKAYSSYKNGTGSKDELKTATDNLVESLGMEKDVVKDLSNDYDKLNEKLNETTLKKLNDNLPNLLNGYKIAKDNALDEVTHSWNELGSNDGVIDFGFSFSNKASDDKVYNNAIKNNKELQELYTTDLTGRGYGIGIDLGNIDNMDDYVEMYEKLQSIRNSMIKDAENGEYSDEDLSESTTFQAINTKVEAMKEKYDIYKSYIDDINNTHAYEDIFNYLNKNGIPKTQEEFDKFHKAIENGAKKSSEYLGGEEERIKAIKNTIADMPEISDFLDGTNRSDQSGVSVQDSQTLTDLFYDMSNGTESAKEKAKAQLEDYAKQMDLSLSQLKASVNTYNIANDIQTLWDSEDFKDSRSDLETLAYTSGITAKDINDLANSNTGLKAILDETGMSADYLAQCLQNMSIDGTDAFANISTDALMLNETLSEMDSYLQSATNSYNKYKAEIANDDYDTQLNNYVEAYKAMGEMFENGNYGKTFRSTASFLFGDKVAGQSVDDIYKIYKNSKSIYGDEDDNGLAFLKKVYSNKSTVLNGLDSTVTKKKDGSFDFDIKTEDFDEIADRMNMTKDAVASCVEALGMFGDFKDYDADKLVKTFKELNSTLIDTDGTAVTSKKNLSDMLESLGYADYEVSQIIDDLSKSKDVEILNFSDGSEKNVQSIVSELQKLSDVDISKKGTDAEGLTSVLTNNFGMSAKQVENFMKKLDNLGYKFKDASGKTTSFNKAVKDMKEQCNNNITSLLSASLTKVKSEAQNATSSFNNLLKTEKKLKNKNLESLELNFDSKNIDDVNEQIKTVENMMNNTAFQKDGKFNISAKGAEELQTIMAGLIRQKQALDEPTNIMLSVNTDAVKGDIYNDIKLIQNYIKANQDLEIKTKMGVDTTKAEKDVDECVKNIQNSKTITSTLNFDTTDKDSIQQSIENITSKEQLVHFGVDSSVIADYQAEDKEAKVTYKLNLDDNLKEFINKDLTKTVKVNYVTGTGTNLLTNNTFPSNTGTKKSSTSKKAKAKVNGTAYARGSWGTKDNGTALVGELGTETIVRDGQYFTVGKNGAEFIDYKKDDIIFNHKQTEELFKNGRVTSNGGRGKIKNGSAFAKGTAFASGSGVTKKKHKNLTPDSTSSKKSTTSNSKSNSKSNSNSSSKSSDKTDKVLQNFQNWISKLFDWIEVRTTRIQTKIDNAIKKAEANADNGNYSASATQYKTAIKNTKSLINANEKGSVKYKQEANAIANKAVKSGLVSKKQMNSIKSKVADGSINISKYGDRMQEVIKNYQTYYEKALDCSNVTLDLTSSLKEYYTSLYNLPIDKASKSVEKLSNALDILSSKAEAVSGGGTVYNRVVTNDAKNDKAKADKAVKTATSNQKSAKKSVTNKGKTLLKDKGLSKSQKKAVKSGKTVSTKGLKGKVLKDAKVYNKAVKNKSVADTKLNNAKKNQSIAITAYNKAKATENKYSNLPTYQQENDLLDKQTDIQKQEKNSYLKAEKEAKANTKSAKKNVDTSKKKVKSLSKKLSKSKNLSKSQKNAVKNGKTISTKGLKGKTLANAKAYNNALKQQKQNTIALKVAQEAETTATQNAEKAQADYAKTLQENSKAKLDNIQASYDSEREINSSSISNEQAKIEEKQSNGEKITRNNYSSIISTATSDEAMAKKEYLAYKKEFEKNKNNMSDEDKKSATANLKKLEEEWHNASKAKNEYIAESIQSEIDNAQEEIDLLKAQNEYLVNAKDKNKNLDEQITKITQSYNLQIEKEKDITKQAQLRYEKEVAIRDILQEQLENIKEQAETTSSWYASQGNLNTANSEKDETSGKDTYNNKVNNLSYDASVQDYVAQTKHDSAKDLYDELHSSKYGSYDENGQFNVLGDMLEAYKKGMADYWNIEADAVKAETQAIKDRYDAWELQNIQPKQDSYNALETDNNKKNSQISVNKASGNNYNGAIYDSIINNTVEQNKNLREQNALYKQQQSQYEVNSTKWKELQEKIDDNEKSILDNEKTRLDTINEKLQEQIDNYQNIINKIEAENELIYNANDKNKNLNLAIEETRNMYDVMIEQENDIVKKAELRAKKEKAVNDILQSQLENIKAQAETDTSWFTSQGNQYSAKESYYESAGKDNYFSKASNAHYDASVQENVAKIKHESANNLYNNLHSSEYGTYNSFGEFIVWSDKMESYMKGMADYWNIEAEAYQAEAQKAQDAYDEWESLYLQPKLDGYNKLQKSSEYMLSENSLKETRGLELEAKDYQSLINNSFKQIENLEQQNVLLHKQQSLYDTNSTKWKELQEKIDDNEKSILSAWENQEKWNQAINQLPITKLEKQLELYDSIGEKIESEVDLKQKKGIDLSANDYLSQINNNNLKKSQYQQERSIYVDYAIKATANLDGVFNGHDAKYWQEKINEIDTDMNKLEADNIDLKKSLRDDVYWRDFEKTHEVLSNIKDTLDGISSLLDENMLFNDNGSFTDMGVAKVGLLVKSFEDARNEVVAYQNDINNLNNLYSRGEYTQDEYNDKLSELQKNLLSSASSMKEVQDSIVEMYKTQTQNELDGIFDLIDARNKLLNKTKEYYEYSKTIKNKTKDVNSIKSNIASLEGIDTQEAKAKRKQLEEQLKDAEDDLQDTVNNHILSLSTDGLDDLKETLQDMYDNEVKEMSMNLEKIAEYMQYANELSQSSASTISATLNSLLQYYGISTSNSGIKTGYAKGTKSVDKNKMAWTQENGSEIVIRKSDGAILTPLEKGDGVIPNDLTSNLYDWGKMTPSEFADSFGVQNVYTRPSSNTPVNVSTSYDSLLRVDGNVDKDALPDLQTILKKSYEYTSKEQAKNLKLAGYKPKF